MNEGQKRAKAYWRYKHTLSLLGLVASVSYLIIIQFTVVSSHLKIIATSISSNFYIAFSIYLLTVSLIYHIVILPLNLYESFILEHKFSLSNQNLLNWVKDDLKKLAISVIFFIILVETLYAIGKNFKGSWWFVSSIVWIIFSIIFTKLFPIFIIPIFYKYNILSNSQVRNRTLHLAKAFNIKVMDVFEIDFSKNTKKANAALVGWGDTMRVILADNLIREFTTEEIEVVVAHEMAHYKLHHIWKLVSIGAIFTVIFFFILSRIAQDIAVRMAASDPFDMSIFPACYLLFILYGIITIPAQNGILRKLEKDADILALKITNLKYAFISLMEKLAKKNMSDENPNALIEFLLYDHPPIAKRIALAKKNQS